jgi:hypothetical protein
LNFHKNENTFSKYFALTLFFLFFFLLSSLFIPAAAIFNENVHKRKRGLKGRAPDLTRRRKVSTRRAELQRHCFWKRD